MNDYKRILALAITAILIVFIAACRCAVNEEKTGARSAADRGVPRVCGDRRPQPLAEGSYGMQPDGTFRFPALAPLLGEERRTFPGIMEEWDVNSYIKNMKVEAAYEGPEFTPDPFHTWQNIVDFDSRRYLFQYDREAARVYDITDVKKVTLVESFNEKDWKPGDFWGASSIQWNKQLGKYIMVQIGWLSSVGDVRPFAPEAARRLAFQGAGGGRGGGLPKESALRQSHLVDGRAHADLFSEAGGAGWKAWLRSAGRLRPVGARRL